MVSLESIGCLEDIHETSASIEVNTMQKVNYIPENHGYICFTVDTGLEIKVLNYNLVFSARYTCKQRNADDSMNKLLPI
ncbi:non-canonical purine NTP pyrophosphatase [Flavobacterium sp. ZT3P35]|uniref:non-canonical purine NTP pyrophosphatase n=1 Tax=Flavobacterium sp. ZT3P35 TaxID=3401727 RepID=UPI003AAA9146